MTWDFTLWTDLVVLPNIRAEIRMMEGSNLIRFRLGHANTSVTDDYSKLKQDVTFREQVAEEVGIGFELPTEKLDVAPHCTQGEVSRSAA